MTPRGPARVTAVVLAWGAEPYLDAAVRSLLESRDVDLDVVLVDNGCTDGAVERLRQVPGVTHIDAGSNTGFAGGCNLGARHATGEFLAFVNSDAVVRPDAVRRLVGVAEDPAVALASASLRLADRPEVMNSAGNPVHYSGLSWAGGFGEDADRHRLPRDIPSITGAAFAVRREAFESLGGFNELMFAYCEDAELSLRAWQRGWRCVYVPEAVVLHHYEFSRNNEKFYLLERNRLMLVLTLFESRTLLLLAPALLGLELATLAVAARQGWARQKVRGWVWLLRHRDEVRDRRHAVQQDRSVGDRSVAPLLTSDFAPGEGTGVPAPGVLRAASRAYWALVRRAL